MDVTTTSAPSTQSATPTSPTGRPSRLTNGAGSSAASFSFADMLQSSLQSSSDSLAQTSHSVPSETKGRGKSLRKDIDSAQQSAGSSQSAAAPNPEVMMPFAMPVAIPNAEPVAAAISADEKNAAPEAVQQAAASLIPNFGDVTAEQTQTNAPVGQIVALGPQGEPLPSSPSDLPGNFTSASSRLPSADDSSMPSAISSNVPLSSATSQSQGISESLQVNGSAAGSSNADTFIAPPQTPSPSEATTGSVADGIPASPTTTSSIGDNLIVSGAVSGEQDVVSANAISATSPEPVSSTATSAEAAAATNTTANLPNSLSLDAGQISSASSLVAPEPSQASTPTVAGTVVTTVAPTVGATVPQAQSDLEPNEASEDSTENASSDTASAAESQDNGAMPSVSATTDNPQHHPFEAKWLNQAGQQPPLVRASKTKTDQPDPAVTNGDNSAAGIPPAKTVEAAAPQTGATFAAKAASNSDNGSNADGTIDPASNSALLQDVQSSSAASQLDTSLSSDDTDSVAATPKRESKSDKSPTASLPAASSTSAAGGTFSTDATANAPATTAAPVTTSSTSTVTSGFVSGVAEPRSAASTHSAAPSITRQNLPEDGPELSAGLRAWNSGEHLQANLAGTPHLVEKLGQSEVNIALQGDALGNVQVRAHVMGDQVGAAITVDHHDVHAALTNDLPSLHQAFADRQLRVDHLSVQQAFSSSSSGQTGAGGGRSEQQSQNSAQRPATYVGSDSPFSSGLGSLTSSDLSESQGAFDSQGRLSVRA